MAFSFFDFLVILLRGLLPVLIAQFYSYTVKQLALQRGREPTPLKGENWAVFLVIFAYVLSEGIITRRLEQNHCTVVYNWPANSDGWNKCVVGLPILLPARQLHVCLPRTAHCCVLPRAAGPHTDL
jgi:hypothetical protein